MKIKDKFKKAKKKIRRSLASSSDEPEVHRDQPKHQHDPSSDDNGSTSGSSSASRQQSSSSTSPSKSSIESKDSSSSQQTGKSRRSLDDESGDEMKEHKDRNFGKTRFVDTSKPAIWNVLVRIIEAKDIDTGGSSRVRVILDGKSKMTRTVTHVIPKWRQNILFTTKKQSLETLADNPLTIKLARPKLTGEVSIGDFSCHLSEVIHLTNKAVISKWVALGIESDDGGGEEDEDFARENCGFLKISICVYRMDETPPQMIDDDGTEEIWSGAHLSDYTLKIRLFSIEMMLRKLAGEKKAKKAQKFYLLVQCGNEKAETTLEVANIDSKQNVADIIFDQEVYLPIQWPSVISQISISLFSKKGRKKAQCIGKAVIPMKKIYEPGEEGFLPTFGPAYLNLFDCERSTRFNWFVKGSTARQEDGCRFVSRLFMSIDCVEYMDSTSSQRLFLDHSSIKEAESFMKSVRRYTTFCSMSALNMINPLFASDAIQILISIGPFGSLDLENRFCSSSTVAAMPNWDGCKYFAMPWGNLRTMTQVKCYFENVDYRVELSNSLMKMSNMLDRMIWEVLRTGNGAALDHVASLGCETLDNLQQMIEAGGKFLENVKFSRRNNLDTNWLQARRRQIVKLKEMLVGEIFDVDYSEDDVDSKLLRMMLRMRNLAKEMAEDIQISLPPIVIKMLSFGKLIGFAKVPISEVYQSDNEVRSGEWCGRRRAINIQWPTLFDQKNRKEEFVAVLHCTMWFGRSENIEKWKEHVEPAEIRYFMDMYEVQTRSLTMAWKPRSDTKMFVTGNWQDSATVPKPSETWKSVGQWLVMNTHDMWVSNCGRQTMHDKAYEVQKRGDSGDWTAYQFTDYYGYQVSEADMKKPMKGWEMSKWVADKLRNNGDKNGWVYTTNGVFFGDGVTVDREIKPHHKYRRRCVKRSRKLEAYRKEHEDFKKYQESLEDTNWEYSIKRQGPFHDDCDTRDTVRRRRYMIEIEKDPDAKDANNDDDQIEYRLYEYQLVTAKWQLRCYIMWAKDLMPIVKNSARAFVRITFANHCQQTLLVDNSQNPIWNETVMFKSILIAGGTREIMHNPPVVAVEVIGESPNGSSEVNLGIFQTPPTVICSNTDSRANPLWYPLRFPKGKTRGAVLACFELFELTDSKDCLPLEPQGKHNYKDRLEIPPELRPQFDKYHVQFLCWGVRNLRKHQLLSVHRPFVDLTIGDQEFSLEPIKDVRKNPNFPEPMISFTEVALPSALELSPPFVVNLYDARAFRRRPLVGTLLISDLHKYVSHIIRKDDGKKKEEENYEEFNEAIDEEHQKLLNMKRRAVLGTDQLVPLDWWSRYYASMSQFHRSPGYPESGMEYLKVFNRHLEEMNGYNNFGDFLDTMTIVKNAKSDFDDPEEKEKAGELKCRLLISKLRKDQPPSTMNPSVDFLGPVKCLVRIYVIEAKGLTSNSKNGRVDSYVTAKCGKIKSNMKKNYKSENCDPIYGELIEMNITIPLEKDLTICIKDKCTILADKEIGSTTIDLENRLLTKWRATCGLSAQYTVQGEMQWRDQLTPMEVLKAYCIRMMLPAPKVLERKNEKNEVEVGLMVYGVAFWWSEVIAAIEKEEKMMVEGQRESAGKDSDDESEPQKKSAEELELEMEKSKKERERKKVVVEKPKEKDNNNKEKKEPQDFRNTNRRSILGTPLESIALFVLRQINLVPEHVETRSLYSDKGGRVLKGTLRMFVDIFPIEHGSIPAPFNITPRKPAKYQLRVSVMSVFGAIPIKRSFAEPTSDLYVKVYVNGMRKGQKTDTHFRVLDGKAEFNWRFLLDFDYNVWEKKVVSYTKTRLFRKPVEELVDPILIVELWDKNKFKKDVLLGEMELDLLSFMEGVGSPSDIGVYSRSSVTKRCCKCPRCCSCLIGCGRFCIETKCLCGVRKIKKKPFPKPVKYSPPEDMAEAINLFDSRNLNGWWPMLNDKYPHPEEIKKKDDDVDENQKWIMGLVEMDIALLTISEAEQDPVGKKRAEPNHSPYLEKPHRKLLSDFWICSRVGPCLRFFWHYYGAQILAYIMIILILALIIYFLFNTWPMIFAHLLTKIW